MLLVYPDSYLSSTRKKEKQPIEVTELLIIDGNNTKISNNDDDDNDVMTSGYNDESDEQLFHKMLGCYLFSNFFKIYCPYMFSIVLLLKH